MFLHMIKVLLSRLGGFGGKTHTTYLNNAISHAQNGVYSWLSESERIMEKAGKRGGDILHKDTSQANN